MNVKEITATNPNPPENAQQLLDEARAKVRNASVVAPQHNQGRLLVSGPTIEVKELPSKFLPYPTSSSIKFKPYTYGQLQKLGASTLNEVDSLKFILEGIITEGFSRENLAWPDFLFIGLLRRLTAFNTSKFNYKFICEECGKDNEQVDELSNIKFDDIENVPSLPVIVDLEDGKTLEVYPLTIGSVIKLRQMNNQDNLVSYAECVKNMKPEEAFKVISNAQGDLIEILQEVDRLLAFNNQTLECKCSMCNAENLFNMGDISNLVQPFRSTPESIKSRLRFGGSGNSQRH